MYLAILILAGGLVRIGMICQTAAISRDGIRYIQLARQFDTMAPQTLARSTDFHLGYSAALRGMYRLLRGMGCSEEVETWDLAGQLVSLLSALLATAGLYAFGVLLLANAHLCFMGVLLFTLGRKWSVIGSDVLSDSTVMCCQIWALVLSLICYRYLLRGNHGKALLNALGVGFLAGLGYLVRPEGLLVMALSIPLWAHAWWAQRSRDRLLVTILAITLAVIATLAVSLPYMLAIGDFSRKKDVSKLTEVWVNQSSEHAAPSPTPTVSTENTNKHSPSSAHSTEEPDKPHFLLGLTYALDRYIDQWFEAAHPLVAFCILIGAIGLTLVRRFEKLEPDAATLPGINWQATYCAAGCTAVMFLVMITVHLLYGYISHRHCLLSAAVWTPIAGIAVFLLSEWICQIGRGLRCPAISSRAVQPVLLSLFCVLLVLHASRPLHAQAAGLRSAGKTLRQMVTPEQTVLALDARIGHYANATTCLIREESFLKDPLGIIIKCDADFIVLPIDAISTLQSGDHDKLKALGYIDQSYLLHTPGKAESTLALFQHNRVEVP